MTGEFHAFGKDDALLALGLEKHAFVGALLNVGRAALAPVGRKVMQTAAGRAMAPAAGRLATGAKGMWQGAKALPGAANRAVERQVTQGAMGAAKRFGTDAARQKAVGRMAHGAIRGVPREMMTQAGMGGVFMGGLGAATAEEGQRWDAFKKGLGEGAMFGAASGAIGGGIRNLRRTGLRRQAAGQLAKNPNALGGLTANQAAEKQLSQGLTDTIKGIGTKAGPMGRAGNVADAVGAAGQFAGEWYLPGMALGAAGIGEAAGDVPQAAQQAANAADPHMMRTASVVAKEKKEEPSALGKLPKRYLGSILGSASGGMLANTTMNLAREAGHLGGTGGIVMRSAIPALAGIAGGLTGYTLGSSFDKPPALVQNLNQVDFDRLLKHYKKEQPGA